MDSGGFTLRYDHFDFIRRDTRANSLNTVR